MTNYIEEEKAVAPAGGEFAGGAGDVSDVLAAAPTGAHTNKYCAFLSYSHEDNLEQRPDSQGAVSRCWGDWLHEALTRFSIPAEFIGQINARGENVPERIQPIFRDGQDLSGDAGLSAEVRQALEQSVCLIVICSPRSAKSRQVNEAVRYFKQLGRGKQVLPFVVAGVPNVGNPADGSPEEECFVPALRHPVKPDGTLDTTRRSSRFLFVDARQEADKREILANADRNAEADLEMAKIQLIALVIGVGFNGLWWREQRRHFLNLAEAQQQALEAANQAEAARRQLAEAQGLAREVQDRMLAAQNLPREVHGQIQEAQNQMRAAQDEAREMQKQLQEFQNKVRETQAELEAARNRTLAAESKVLEAQNQAQSVRNLLEETRVQAREERAREERALEVQASLSQAETTRDQAQAANQQLQEAQSRVLELQEQARSAQAQLAEAREEVREAQAKILEAQQQAETARKQLEEIRNQAPPAQVVQSQTEEVLGEAVHDEAIRLQVQAAHDKLVEAESRVQELQYQTRTAQTLLEEARQQAREAQAKIAEAQNQAREAQDKVRGIQNQSRTARRLIRVFAVLAALSLLAASIAWRQRLAAGQAAPEVAAGTIDLSQIGSDRQPIQQVLENRQRSLDHLAAGIPQAEIPDALKASPVILSDQERSRFQKWLLIRLGWVNPASAMTSAAGIDGKIVNDAGSEDSACYFQLAVLDNWMRTDLAGAFHWACQLTDAVSRQHALEVIMQDPVRAVRLQQPIAGMPAGEAQNAAIHALLSTWAPVEPEKAANWLQAFSETNAQPEQVQYVVRVWAQRDPAAAAHWLATLPAGTADDGVASAFLAGAVASQPAFAWQWTESVSDETQRQKFQLQVIRQWLQADPLGYGLWSESRDLP